MKALVIFLTALALAGCSQPAQTFYMLTPTGPVPSGGGMGLGIGPITLAEYIDRANLVVQEAPNQLGVAEDHRWAGDLSASVSRVIAANLGRELRTGNVRIYPWLRDDEVRYQIVIDIRQLHCSDDGYAVIEAGWRIYSLPDRRLVVSRTFTGRDPLDADGYQAMVAAQSRLLGRLADSIAKAVR